jgi:hypothetical protein
MKISRSPSLVPTAHAKSSAPLAPSDALAIESPLSRRAMRARQRTLGSLMALTSALVMTGCVAEPDRDLGAEGDVEETTQGLTASTSDSMSITDKHSNMCLDVWGASTADGAAVHQGTCNGGNNQKLRLVPAGDSYYNAVVEHSGKCVDVANASTADGAAIRQITCNGGDNQKFRVADNYDGYHWLVAKHSGKCLDVADASMSNSGRIQQFSCHGRSNQKFKLQGRKFYNIKPVDSGLCFDVAGASSASGAPIMQGDCHGGDNQRFDLYLQSNGYYHIVNKNSGKCVDVDSASTAGGAEVKQSDCHSGDNQMFHALDLGNGRYSFVARHSGKCLDVGMASTADAAPIKEADCNGGTTQQLTLDELAPPKETTPPIHEITNYGDFAGLKHIVAHDPDVIKNLATLAQMLGFAFPNGTQTTTVGEGFDVTPEGDSYVIQAHHSPSDANAGGYRPYERLKITLSDFRTVIDPGTFVYGQPVITSLLPCVLAVYTASNAGDVDDVMTHEFEYTLSTTTSHATNVSFNSGFSVAISRSAQIPFSGQNGATCEATTEFNFSSDRGWSDQTSTTEIQTISSSYTGTIPAQSKREIALMVLESASRIDYTASAKLAFNVAFTGYLRSEGNARSDHPTSSPTVTLTFGNKDAGVSGLQDILDQYDHSEIDGYSSVDWKWAKIANGAAIRDVMRVSRGDIGVPLSGGFVQVQGTSTYISAQAPQPL